MSDDPVRVPELFGLIDMNPDDPTWLQDYLRESLPKPQAVVLVIGTTLSGINEHFSSYGHRHLLLSSRLSIACLVMCERDFLPTGRKPTDADPDLLSLVDSRSRHERELAPLIERLNAEVLRDHKKIQEVVITLRDVPDLTGLLPIKGKRFRSYVRPENQRKPIPPSLSSKTHRRLQSFHKG